MGKLKDKFAKLVRGPAAVWDKTVSDPQQKHPTTRAFTDSAEADGIPISKPDR